MTRIAQSLLIIIALVATGCPAPGPVDGGNGGDMNANGMDDPGNGDGMVDDMGDADADGMGDGDMMGDDGGADDMSGDGGEDDIDAELAVFEDPDSDFTTQDVRDVDGQIVRFNATLRQLIWVEDDLAFDGFDVDGNLLSNGFFTVRFGTEDGVRQAYFTETTPPTICDITVMNGQLRIFSTTETVPQE